VNCQCEGESRGIPATRKTTTARGHKQTYATDRLMATALPESSVNHRSTSMPDGDVEVERGDVIGAVLRKLPVEASRRAIPVIT
jgi:hypothetical protein